MSLSIIKEFREFFLRDNVVPSGSKPDQQPNYPVTYTTTNLLGQVITAYNRFLINNYPTADVFSKLFNSITFKLNPEDTATTSIQGIVKIPTDADAWAKTQTWGDNMNRALAPYQVPDVLVNPTTGNITVTKGYVPVSTGIWQSGVPGSGAYRIGYQVSSVADETWKTIGAGGNFANGQAVPAYASGCEAPPTGTLPLQARLSANGKLCIRGWIRFSTNPTSPQIITTLPTGYQISSGMGIVTLACNAGSGSFPLEIQLTPNGNITFSFISTFTDTSYLNIPEQEISLI